MNSLRDFEPGRNDLCLCGSGRKFKRCCRSAYGSNAGHEAFLNYNQGRYGEALGSCRAHITWYILCHRAHTRLRR